MQDKTTECRDKAMHIAKLQREDGDSAILEAGEEIQDNVRREESHNEPDPLGRHCRARESEGDRNGQSLNADDE